LEDVTVDFSVRLCACLDWY